ncbi:MAG: hypothetical protein B7X91_03030 [Hydrogenophilales bacterium 17-64-11]|nr:MAG: hypothetical protein B7X91_03030 [Hydrogenophilales bacterium 17-64-11]
MPTLNQAALLAPCRIARVDAPEASPEWRTWLEEIGFLPGEQAMLMARAPGGDPLVVHVGGSTFALRCAEAACVEIEGG